MKLLKAVTIAFLLQQCLFSAAQAGDFAWLDALAVEARADASGFVAKLAARFHIGDAQVTAVIDDIGAPADAYMVLRLAEMSHKPVDKVVEQYRVNRNKGWGVMAKRLGIKPGSKAFHALKRGHDLPGIEGDDRGHNKGKGKGNGHGHGRDKH